MLLYIRPISAPFNNSAEFIFHKITHSKASPCPPLLLALIIIILLSVGVLVSAQNQETCSGLEQLARNSNSNLLSSCVRDAKCTRVTCQAAGLLSSYIGSVTFTLRPCEAMPGIEMGVFESSGAAIVDQLITSPTTITRRISIASVSIHVFVNSTASSIGISVRLFNLSFMYAWCLSVTVGSSGGPSQC